jgi:hypothetical protein
MFTPPAANTFEKVIALTFLSVSLILAAWTGYLKRHVIAYNIGLFLVCFSLWWTLAWVGDWLLGFKSTGMHYVALVLCMPLSLLIKWKPRRGRGVKRQAINDYRRWKGSYDSALHHVDHFIPLSRGGAHTRHNLWVISKERNLKKGVKPPTWRDWIDFAAYRFQVWRAPGFTKAKEDSK